MISSSRRALSFRRLFSAQRILLCVWALLFLAGSAASLFVGIVRLRRFHEHLPPHVGNSEEVRRRVPAYRPSQPFCFAAVGDLRADETFDALFVQLRKEPLAFMVLLGDVARNPRREDHLFLRYKAHAFWQASFPVFLLPGNHDVDPVTFPVERFEKLYGPVRFSLLRGPLRFVFLDLLPTHTDNREALSFLEKELRAASQLNQRVFVFGHCSPHVSPYVGGRSFAGEQRLVSLLAGYGVQYYLGGDFHGYVRTQRGPTTFLATGGGGAHLVHKGGLGFHHATLLSILPEGVVAERLCVVPKHFRATNYFTYFALIGWVRIGWFVLLIPVGCAVLGGAALVRRYRKTRGTPAA